MWRSAVQLCLGLRNNGGLAQLARASALHAEGQRFESVILHQRRRMNSSDGGCYWLLDDELFGLVL